MDDLARQINGQAGRRVGLRIDAVRTIRSTSQKVLALPECGPLIFIDDSALLLRMD